ncbi:MAG: AMP-binding protein, partial [Actinomycetia bacterium]|nr:AMP-binding protein [Actinomycetes bacterium]
MPELIAIDLPGGRPFVEALERVWDEGNAALPLDQRLDAPARAELIALMGASHVIGNDGRVNVAAGLPVEHGDALVVPTSGSTGNPKGVVLTHDAVRASAVATSDRLGVDAAADTWLACLPLSHVGGLSVVTRALHTGTALVVHPGFDAEMVEVAGRSGVSAVSLVSTALRRIDASLFRVVLLGGSAIPANRPDNSVATYGMTESGS